MGKALKFISSWWLTSLVLTALCATYVFFAATGKHYEDWAYFVFHSPAGMILYITLIINLVLASIRIASLRPGVKYISPESIAKMDAYIEVPFSERVSGDKVADWIKQKGFSAEINRGIINSVKSRFSFLPGMIMRTGIVILMISLLISIHIRKTDEKIFHEGESGHLLKNDVSLSSIRANMPEEFLLIGEKGTFKLNNVSATIFSNSKSYNINSWLPSSINGRYYRITHIGYHLPLLLKASGREYEKSADIDVLPPGKTAIAALPAGDMFLIFTLHPVKTIKKGITTGKVFNLRAPSFSLVVQKDKARQESIIIRPGETAKSGAVDITLGNNSMFVKIQSVYDPALRWIYTGILLTISGMILMFSRFFWYEKQMCAIFLEDKALIGYSEEFYKKWGIMKLHEWKEELTAE